MVKIQEIRTVPDGPPQPLDRLVRDLFGVSWNRARRLVTSGKVFVDGEQRLVFEQKIRPGSAIELRLAAAKTPARALSDDRIAYVDAQVVVVRKPAGISSVPFEDEPGPTLDELVRNWLARKGRGGGKSVPPLGVVHRLDKETSGLLVFTRTWVAKQSLSSQFRAHTVHRKYLAIATGTVKARTIRSSLAEDRGDGLRGSVKHGGRLAITHVEVVEKLEAATLIACKLETGRTHQIRIHLSEAGHPIAGERVYCRGLDPIPAPRLMLHAAELGFDHPTQERPMRFEEDPPMDFQSVLADLRG